MPILYTVFYSADSPYWTFTNILYSIRKDLYENNIIYNPQDDLNNHVPSHYYLSRSFYGLHTLGNSPKTAAIKIFNDSINSHFQKLDEDASSGSDIICSLGMPHYCIPDLYFKFLNDYSHLKNRNHKIIIILSRQDLELYSLTFSAWKRLSQKQNFENITDISASHKIDEFYSSLVKYCDARDIKVLINDSDDPFMAESSIQHEFINHFGLDGKSCIPDCRGLHIPQSVPALDLHRATYHFPFHVKRAHIPDRESFLQIIGNIEKEEGFEKFRGISKEYSHKLLEMCSAANHRLASMRGLEGLFSTPHPLDAIPDLPAEMPSITHEQCRCFVSAFSPEFRSALLRHFKDMPHPLHQTEHALAKSIEEYEPRPLHAPARKEPLLTVLTLSKNHEKYIRQCMEGVAAQQTSFPIEHVVIDVFSSDSTASVIENFASRNHHVHPVYLTNLMATNNIKTLFSLCHTKYAAICDGDDFFTDPLKLQKQVDFLEAHAECSMCFHPVEIRYEDGSPSRRYPPEAMLPGGIRPFYTIRDLLKGNMMQTSSVVYRWRFTQGLPEWFVPNMRQADWYWHLLHAEVGLIGFINECMSVYRRHAGALYADAEKGHLAHRTVNGLGELQMYKLCNEHFKNRFYRDFYLLSAGVLADFLHIYATTGDDRLLQEGITLCPHFGRDFLASIKVS